MEYIYELVAINNNFSRISNENITNKDNKNNLNKIKIVFKSTINHNYNKQKNNSYFNDKNNFLIFLITFILLINKILCESYIILKINKYGKRNILFHWGIEFGGLCRNVPMHIPKKMLINGELINPPVGEYNFYFKKENIVKLVYDDTKDNFKCLFYGCSDIEEIDVSHLITSNVNNMAGMFYLCSSLTSLDLTKFNTGKVTTMNSMFDGCSNLKYLNVHNFNTKLVIDMGWMFSGCSSLESLDITNFNTAKVSSMRSMFSSCSSLTTLDLTHFVTSSVRDMGSMLYYCEKLTTINLSKFNTASTTNFEYMFFGCKLLKALDITKFNTGNALNMRYMFGLCISLTKLDLSKFVTSKVYDMSGMFYGCSSLISLDLSKFVTNQVKDMHYMFNECSSLISLGISKFDTSKVTDMLRMFSKCTSLTTINLSSFKFTNVKNMTGLFEKCSKLQIIDLSNFITSSAITMRYMFAECSSLQSLDFSKFDTKNVIDMSNMFNSCKNLKSLKLNKFNTINVENMEKMFYGCSNLASLDISSFKTSKVKLMTSMFDKCISLTTLDISNFDTSQVNNTLNMFQECSSITSIDLSKFSTSLIENMNSMFYNNKKLTSLDLSKFDFSKVSSIQNMFDLCSNLKYINLKSLIINDNIKYTSLIDKSVINQIICIDDGQSLKKIISLYKCYKLNELENWGAFKDKITNDNNIYIKGCLLSKYDTNCYQICSFYYYYDDRINKYFCTDKLKCVEPYDKLIYDTNECVKSCIKTRDYRYEFLLGKVCVKNCPEYFYEPHDKPFSCKPKCPFLQPFLLVEKLECVSYCTIKQRQNKLCITDYHYSNDINFQIFDEVVSQTRKELLNNFDSSVVNGGIINENGDNITITLTEKEDKKDNGIYLGECEKRLKQIYNIPQSNSLYVLRLDIRQIGYQESSLQYEILYPIYNYRNLVKLNLSICSDINLNRTIYANIKGNIDRYNRNSPYYKDICYLSDSENGVDITLKDKKEDFINNNLGICEDECKLISYNYETKKAVCSCGIKTEIPLLKNIKLDKETLLNSFTDINNIANIQMLKCYKVVFKKNNIIKNIGCYIYIGLIILNLACLLYFIIKDYKSFSSIIYKLKIYFLYNTKKNKNKSLNIYRNNNKTNYLNHINDIKSSKNQLINNNKVESKKNKSIKIYSPLKYNNDSKRIIIKKNNISKKSNNHHFSSNNLFSKKDKNIKLNCSELNHLAFKDALTKDNRTFIQYYFSLLKSNHLIIYIFNSNDYNLRAIKMSIFIFNLASDIAINSLFFNDSTMHKIYTDHGEFDFVYQLPQIIYSTIISTILNFLINSLGLSEQNILKIKNSNIISKYVHKKFNNLFRILKIKFLAFYIIDFILLLLFWYYVTCFCGIYRNTQIHLLKDSLFSFTISLIIPCILYLIPGLFRMCALKRKNKALYGFSKILQTI